MLTERMIVCVVFKLLRVNHELLHQEGLLSCLLVM